MIVVVVCCCVCAVHACQIQVLSPAGAVEAPRHPAPPQAVQVLMSRVPLPAAPWVTHCVASLSSKFRRTVPPSVIIGSSRKAAKGRPSVCVSRVPCHVPASSCHTDPRMALFRRSLLSWVADAVGLRRSATRDVMRECQRHKEGCPAMEGDAAGSSDTARVQRQIAALPRIVTLQHIADAAAGALSKLLAHEQRWVLRVAARRCYSVHAHCGRSQACTVAGQAVLRRLQVLEVGPRRSSS